VPARAARAPIRPTLRGELGQAPSNSSGANGPLRITWRLIATDGHEITSFVSEPRAGAADWQSLSPALRAAIAGLRQQGETVVCVLPGHESEVDEFHCDRELARQGTTWAVRSL